MKFKKGFSTILPFFPKEYRAFQGDILKDGSLQGTGGRKPPAYPPQDHKVLEQLASTQLGNLPLKTPTNSPSASGLGMVDVAQAVFIPLMKSHFHSMFFPVFRDIKRDVLELTHPVHPSLWAVHPSLSWLNVFRFPLKKKKKNLAWEKTKTWHGKKS